MTDLIGLTIKEAIAKIERIEKRAYFQVYVLTEKTIIKDLKKLYKRFHKYNENHKRVYDIHTILKTNYAIDKSIESNDFIIDARIEKESADLWSFNGYENTEQYNCYYLIVNELAKGNKGKSHYKTIKTETIEYKEGELTPKQRRIVL